MNRNLFDFMPSEWLRQRIKVFWNTAVIYRAKKWSIRMKTATPLK